MNECGFTHLDLFSGIGGFALAVSWLGGRTVGFCECEPYARRVIAKHWPDVRCHDDACTLDGTQYRGVSLVTGGYPCQPFSHAGKRRGTEDDRHLWPEMRRIIDEARPAYVLAENVAGHVTMGLDEVLSDLESIGYACGAVVVPACAVDAMHRRDRVWVMGHADGEPAKRSVDQGAGKRSETTAPARPVVARDTDRSGSPSRASVLADSECVRGAAGMATTAPRQARGTEVPHDSCPRASGQEAARRMEQWLAEPAVGRVANGIAARVDRLRGLGNAIVPQVAYEILRTFDL